MPRFFISHSFRDKALATELKSRLGDEAWVDLFEIDLGDLVLDKIEAGLNQATDFVLLWSEHSASSRWVQFEFQMAFIRWLEDQAIAIRIICLDQTELRLPLRPFLQYRGADVDGICRALLESPISPPMPQPFVNRNNEINHLERAFYSTDEVSAWMCGMSGVGKRATVREALRRLVPDLRRQRRLRVREGTAEIELLLHVMASLGDHDPHEGRPWTPMDALGNVALLMGQFVAGGGVWIFEEAQHWLQDDGSPSKLLDTILTTLEQTAVPVGGGLAIFSSTRYPDLRSKRNGAHAVVHINGLAPEFGVALLKTHGATEDDDLLRKATVQLAGHPLALSVVAGRIGDAQLDWSAERLIRARSIVSRLRLSEPAEALLETIAIVDGPLPVEQLASHLGLTADQTGAAVASAVSYSLLREDDYGYLDLHPIVKDYFVEAFRTRTDRHERFNDLADRARRALEATSPGAPRYVQALISTYWLLAMANRMLEAQQLRSDLHGTLFSAGVELYRQQRYQEALGYFEHVDPTSEKALSAQLYEARCLAYVGRVREARVLVDESLAREPRNHFILRVRGRVEFIAGEWRDALTFYTDAYSIRPQYTNLLVDIAQCNIRLGKWEAARTALEDALRRGDQLSYTLNFYSQVLEHDGDFKAALEHMRRAVALEPRNPVFQHRLGQIAERTGNYGEAREHFEDALKLDPNSREAGLSLASLLVDQGQLDRATNLLDLTERLPGTRKTVVANIRAKLQLARGQIIDARASIQRALNAAPLEIQNLGLAARIEVEAAEQGLISPDLARARVNELAAQLRSLGEDSQATELELKVSKC